MNLLQWLTSKLRLRWLGDNRYELKPKRQLLVEEDDDFEVTIKKLEAAGWRQTKRSEYSVMMTLGEEE